MRALSIRQPYAEEILQGIKTIEYRPNPTKKIGERFFIYAALKYPSPADLRKFCKRYRTMKLIREAERGLGLEACGLGKTDLDRPPQVSSHKSQAFSPPQAASHKSQAFSGGLPRGVIVGIATISHVTPPTKKMPYFHWHLTDVERLELPMKPHRMPQAQWFAPFNLPTVPKRKGNRSATMKLKLVRD